MDTTVLVDGITQKESRIDKTYFKTFPGIIKLAEIALTIICLVMVSSWFRFILCIIFILTLICTSAHLFRIRKKIKKWALIEFYVTGVVTGLFVVGMVTQFLSLHFVDGIFSAISCLAYAVGTYLLYREQRSEVLEASGVTEVVESNFNRTIQNIPVFH